MRTIQLKSAILLTCSFLLTACGGGSWTGAYKSAAISSEAIGASILIDVAVELVPEAIDKVRSRKSAKSEQPEPTEIYIPLIECIKDSMPPELMTRDACLEIQGEINERFMAECSNGTEQFILLSTKCYNKKYKILGISQLIKLPDPKPVKNSGI